MSISVFVITCVVFATQLVEYIVIFMTEKGWCGCTLDCMKLSALWRLCLSFAIEISIIVMLLLMTHEISGGLIHVLSDQNCSNDPIMQANFVEIANF